MALHVGRGQKVVLDDNVEEANSLDDLELVQSNKSRRLQVGSSIDDESDKPVESKKRNKLTDIKVSIGWEGLKNDNGIFKKLLNKNKDKIDLDISVFMLDRKGKLRSNDDIIYFNNLESTCGSVRHLGDVRYGAKKGGDDENIIISLDKIPDKIGRIVLVSTIHDSIKNDKHFGFVEDSFVKLKNKQTKKNILELNLDGKFDDKYSIILAEIKRKPDGLWEFNGIGKGLSYKTLNEIRRIFI